MYLDEITAKLTIFLGFSIHGEQLVSLSIFSKRATKENKTGHADVRILHV
jgi:hypothetical protein